MSMNHIEHKVLNLSKEIQYRKPGNTRSHDINWLIYFFSFAVLSRTASADLTPGQDRSHTPDQRESQATLSPQRSLAHATANHTVPPRAKSLALIQTLASHAPRVDLKSKWNVNPEVAPKTNLPIRSLEAAHVHVHKVEMKNIPQDLLLARTVSSPSPQPSALRPDPGLALEPGQPPKTISVTEVIDRTLHRLVLDVC